MRQTTVDVSKGGVCFNCLHAIPVGETLVLEIDACRPAFSAEGTVRWCQQEGKQFLVGVAFKDQAVQFAIRMVEQVCHIEAYRRQLEDEKGVSLSSEQAARRWISEFAAGFPAPD